LALTDRPLLVLATSGPHAEVGLQLPGGDLRVRSLGDGAERGRGLFPTIRALLSESGLKPTDLAGIVVDIGPGSFTGTRVGVTAAKTLAFALSIPAFPVVSLQVLAFAADAFAASAAADVLPIRDAGRGKAYFAVYGSDPDRTPRVPPQRGDADTIRGLQGDAVPIGEDAPRLAADLRLPGSPLKIVAGARACLLAARTQLLTGSCDDFHVLYLQLSTPELRLRGEEP
jgi:tRNA threonylcarbamoyl adenosine modification protein YeaZ